VNEVSSRPLKGLLAAARKLNFDVPALVAGLPFDEKSVEQNIRVDWDVFVEFVDRLQRAAGGLDQLRKVGEHHHDTFPEVQKLVGHFVSPLRFFRFFWGPISRSAFPHILVDYVEHPPDEVIITTTLPSKYRDCPGFFVLTEELTRTGTRLIGMPPCKIETALHPRSATYHVTLPRPRVLAARIDDVAEAAMAAVDAIHSRYIQMFRMAEAEATTDHQQRLARIASACKLTKREVEVFRLLVRGQSNKDIASALGCAESTVETHVSHLLRKTRAGSRTELVSQISQPP
jgi:DNA-binding CsgD family transcriptional regulator